MLPQFFWQCLSLSLVLVIFVVGCCLFSGIGHVIVDLVLQGAFHSVVLLIRFYLGFLPLQGGQLVLDRIEELVDAVRLGLEFLANDLALLPSLDLGHVVGCLPQQLE